MERDAYVSAMNMRENRRRRCGEFVKTVKHVGSIETLDWLSQWYNALGGSSMPADVKLSAHRWQQKMTIGTPDTVYFACNADDGICEAYFPDTESVPHPLDDECWPFRAVKTDIGDDIWRMIFAYLVSTKHRAMINLSFTCKRFHRIICREGLCWLPFFARWDINFDTLEPSQYFMCAVKHMMLSPSKWADYVENIEHVSNARSRPGMMEREVIEFLSDPMREKFLVRFFALLHFYDITDLSTIKVSRGVHVARHIENRAKKKRRPRSWSVHVCTFARIPTTQSISTIIERECAPLPKNAPFCTLI